MDLHSGARTCPASRALLIERIGRGWCVSAAARAAGVSGRTAYKWMARHAAEGEAGLRDHSSRPRTSPTALTLEEACCVQYLRHTRMTAARIARSLELPRSTVARALKRQGLSRLKSLEWNEPPRRYNRRHPGELIHLDVKKLGRITGFYGHRITGDRRRRRRGAGWDFFHVAIDDASRPAYAEVLPNEQGDTSAAFLEPRARLVRAPRHPRPSHHDRQRLGLRLGDLWPRLRPPPPPHLRTRPYRPCTNGKAERFIQTLLREWAYVRPYRTSGIRARALPLFLRYYNRERPHGGPGARPPICRLKTAV